MAGPLTLSMLVVIVFCVITEIGREVCLKYAADRAPDVMRLLFMPVTWLGTVFWATELFGWMVVLESVPLSIAFPLMALSYVAMVFAGAWFFGESVNFRHGVGVFLITAGVICVGITGL
ncbi:permease [Phyllobacterium salinisoli]|uniref:Permease n=1 Tax=Phyllobacterium salinisoli TaxID=1899321 RepID=A0A368K0Y6_9HYPH|nr:permease [Phyllobacterium salinisoli]RCS21650.1 permease [Phyllobacterium salinisoli]